jgi:hypothetical protein
MVITDIYYTSSEHLHNFEGLYNDFHKQIIQKQNNFYHPSNRSRKIEIENDNPYKSPLPLREGARGRDNLSGY